MYLAAAAIYRIKFKKKLYENTPIYTINTKFLQRSDIRAKVTSLLQYTYP